jgi:hypothetical protein
MSGQPKKVEMGFKHRRMIPNQLPPKLAVDELHFLIGNDNYLILRNKITRHKNCFDM